MDRAASLGAPTRHVDEWAVIVRPLRRRDIPAVVDLRRILWPDDVSTAESYAWTIDHTDPAEAVRRWVATADGRIAGFAVAGRAVWTSGDVASMYFGVRPDHRGGGIGSRLYEAAQAHVARLAPTRTMSAAEKGDEASTRFLATRGFRHTRDDQAWSVDPRTVRLDEFADRLADAEMAGLRLLPVRLLMKRPKELYRLHQALEHDLPSDTPIARSYTRWRILALENPLFAPEASFCVMAGDEPVSSTWIMLDRDGRRAQHGMTGTLPEYRHRGLARLVKLASIAWLAAHGVTALYTDNDTENHDMLGLNERLGFRPLTVFELWAREGWAREG